MDAVIRAAGGLLDFELGPREFVLALTATDSGSPSASGTATVSIEVLDVNEKPVPPAGRAFTVPENTNLGTLVGAVASTDPDFGQEVRHFIISGNVGGAFELSQIRAELRVAGALDYESRSSYALMIEVRARSLARTG